MTSGELDALRQQLIVHEGLRLKPYRCTAGKLTIGVGRNLDDKGITREEAVTLLNHDINECLMDLGSFSWFYALDAVRQRALLDLRFNLGPLGFRAFKRMIGALEEGDPVRASQHLRESKWYDQVGQRGPRLVSQLANGKG